MTENPDRAWKEPAEKTRQALGLLGYPLGPRCLPGEPQACGGSYSEHAFAHLVALKAVADHQLSHLGEWNGAYEHVYDWTAADVAERCGRAAR
jgi:hypothetical protein